MYNPSDVFGNKNLIEKISSASKNGRLSHSYIITGASGTGKTLLANIFAKIIQCENKDFAVPCGSCLSCRSFDGGNHPDVIYVRPTKKKVIGIDDIREQVISQASIKPYKYEHKIFIIENADTLSEAAQNALLKTLEEPPHYVIFIMTALSAKSMLTTVLSRSVILKTEDLSSEDISAYLEKNLGLSKADALFYGEYARGSIGEALKISSSETFLEMRETVFQIISSADTSSLSDFTENAKLLEKYKSSTEFLDLFIMYYRDLMVVSLTGSTQNIIQKDKADFLISQAKKENPQNISDKLEAAIKAKQELGTNANFNLCIEIMLIKIKEKTI